MKRLLRNIALLAALLGTTACHRLNDAEQGWYPIEPIHRPYVRWWWLGSAVDREEISYQIEEFARKGFGGVEITPIYGVQGGEADEIEYLSPRWMEMLGHTLSEGQRLGLGIDLNNGTGWPFGGPTIDYDRSARKMVIERWSTDKSGWFEAKITPSDERQKPIAQLVTVVARCNDKQEELTHLVADDGLLKWQAPTEGEWKIYALFSGRTRQRVKRAAPGGEGLVVNHYDSCALHHYLGRFEQAFAESGVAYPATLFNDSFEVYGASWDEKLPDHFLHRRGYRLTDYLPELAGEGDAEVRARVVSDYRESIAELLLEQFTLPWTAWAHRHNALTRNQAHGSPANLIDIYAAVDIPECESFGRSEFDLPTLRHDSIRKPNDGTPAVLKFASSAAHLTGKRTTSAEALTWLTEHFRTSLAQCKPEIDQMFASGVNHIVYHGAPYSPREVAFPGWRFYAAINMSPTAPLWRDVRSLNDYVARCQSFLSAGESDNELLLYLPQYDLWHNHSEQPFLIFDIHKMDRTMPQVKAMMDRIVASGYDADYLSDSFLQQLSVKRGELLTKAGTRYKALLVPACHKMPTESLAKLIELARQGATILVTGHYPTDLPGLGREKERGCFEALLGELPRPKSFDLTESHPFGRGRIITGAAIESLIAEAGIEAEPFKREGYGAMIRRRNEIGGHNYFLSLLTNRPIDGWLTLATDARSALLLDPLTGQAGVAELRRNDRGGIAIRLQLEPGQSLLIKTSAYEARGEKWPYVAKRGEMIGLTRGWSISFTESHPAIEQRFETDTLTDWTLLPDPRASINRATARYEVRFTLNDPTVADDWLLDLGDVRESAEIFLNGEQVTTLVAIPFRTKVGKWLRKGENLLQVEVTNLPSNYMAEQERRGVRWRIFKDANIASVTGVKSFSFGDWPTDPSGLLGEVSLTPLHYDKTDK